MWALLAVLLLARIRVVSTYEIYHVATAWTPPLRMAVSRRASRLTPRCPVKYISGVMTHDASLVWLSVQVWDVLTANLRFPLGGGGVRDKRRINALYVRPPLLAEDAAAAAPWSGSAGEQPRTPTNGQSASFDAAHAARTSSASSPLESLVYSRSADAAAARAGAPGVPPVLPAGAAGGPAGGEGVLGSFREIPAAEAPARLRAVLSQEAVALSREAGAGPGSSSAAPARGALPPSQAAMAAPKAAMALSQAAVAAPGLPEAAPDLLRQKDPWDTIVCPLPPPHHPPLHATNIVTITCALPLAEPSYNTHIPKNLHAHRLCIP